MARLRLGVRPSSNACDRLVKANSDRLPYLRRPGLGRVVLSGMPTIVQRPVGRCIASHDPARIRNALLVLVLVLCERAQPARSSGSGRGAAYRSCRLMSGSRAASRPIAGM